MPDNKNSIITQLRGFDAGHYAATERYAKQIERLYNTACDEFARIGAELGGSESEFSFDKFPKTRKQAQGILTRLVGKIEAVITTGTKTEWLAACKKNDAFISSILRTTKLTKEEVEQYQSRNLDALSTFQRRKVEGLGLSERVWKYAGELKDAMELGIDVALGEGRSAQELSRDLRGYLQEPERLYRRVRDKGGNLRLSKAAKLYHPGYGVYRSSAKNAQRLARTEVNMAYRESDFLRWQKLDFVVGFRVMLSNNHTIINSKGEKVPFVDICDELWGDYPKTFKFTGWHPQCRCYVVPILSDYDEYNQDRANRLKAIVRKAKYESLPSRRTITDVPVKFREYIESIKERAKGWKSMPYYIRDNFKGGKIEGGLKAAITTPEKQPITTAPVAPKKTALEIARERHAARTPEQIRAIKDAWEARQLQNSQLNDAINNMASAGIEYNEAKVLQKPLSTDEIINRLAGGDMTKGGSCSSLALAYAGNRCGYDVLDFRGGGSRDFFASPLNVRQITERLGGIREKDLNGFTAAHKIFPYIKEGKEYYFTSGKHAVIVRRTSKGLEYLELQDEKVGCNKFYPLTDDVLRKRFGTVRSHKEGRKVYIQASHLIDVELFRKDAGFRKMLGYINTEAGKQMKGAGGSKK